jgi:diguanylate cyclase (GGDEF)-like protein/putative nucleotidyltransferase with HDIG domain
MTTSRESPGFSHGSTGINPLVYNDLGAAADWNCTCAIVRLQECDYMKAAQQPILCHYHELIGGMSLSTQKLINSKTYIASIISIGSLTFLATFLHWTTQDPLRFAVFFLMAAIGSAMKVTLPGVQGTMSVGFLIVLIGIMELSPAEVVAIATVGALTQCFWYAKQRPKIIQIAFNLACMCIAVTTTETVYRSSTLRAYGMGKILLLAIAACTQFLANTLPIASVIALSERKSLKKIWRECYFWSFPYYMVGAGVACIFSAVSRWVGWQAAMVSLPITYVIYRSYRQYLERLETEKNHAEQQRNHAEQMARLHLRTIEALALAIDAKDSATHDHLCRVQTYAVEVGKELGLDEAHLDALRAAAVLHDIGKLAVPEHIISKPGKLTPEEFEKMKIHPIVGAEILEQVEFPYPVVPIVLAHHEKWDGSGYPYGLKADDIPIGARILSVVDCLDALASHRSYRPALPLDEALAFVAGEANRSFDPKVVEVLCRRFVELESMAQSVTLSRPKLSTTLRIERGHAPDAGFEDAAAVPKNRDFASLIAAATHEAQALFELSQALGNSLSLNETLSVLAMRLKGIVPHDTIAIYLVQDQTLVPQFVSGDESRLFSSLRIPVGQGVSGWVTQTQKPLLNGNPSAESEYLNDPSRVSTLRSALAVPLEGVNGTLGVLTLYRGTNDAFSRDHLRLLLALSAKLALSVENALKYQEAESSATTDFLTSLPNARSLFLQLDSEVSRCKRNDTELVVIVCDLDNFKHVNDRLGHLEGNRVLQLVAQGLREGCRNYDYAARMGGDEFVLILPNLPREAVQTKVRQISEMVKGVGRLVGDARLGVSVGEAYYPGDGLDAEDLLAGSDLRMYKAKQQHKSGRQPTSASGPSSAAQVTTTDQQECQGPVSLRA